MARAPARVEMGPPVLAFALLNGGGGIRTLGTGVARTTVFKTVAFNRFAHPS